MSDILIKGMKMPKNCFVCKFKNLFICDGDCPIIELPKHCRLIDANALRESIKEARKKDPEIEDVYIDDYFMVAEWVVSAPTIIEAEGI